MENREVASLLSEFADRLEIDGANTFRVRAYRNASRTIAALSESVASMSQHPNGLRQLDGIGKDLAEKIATLVETGTESLLEELRAKIPDGVLAMRRLPGVGPKTAARLFRELGITTLEGLETAARDNRIAALDGFSQKTQNTILSGLAKLSEQPDRILLGIARPAAEALVVALRATAGVVQADVAGSCRRWVESVGDLDVLVAADEPTAGMDCVAAHESVESVLMRGSTKLRVRLRSGVEVDVRVVPPESYGAAMQYFTGSKEHNIVVRRRAQDRDLKLNEYGLFAADDSQVAGATEDEIYAAVGLSWIPPELRENRGEIAQSEAGELPTLVTVDDMRGDLHMHTTRTDGTASIAEMARAAKQRGLSYIAITDHSKRVRMANGLDADALREHWADIEAARRSVPGIEILRGVECDILEDATLDLPDEVLAEADWVLAVLHFGLQQPREQIKRRLLNAIRCPHVDCIGHLTGRILGKRLPADVDFGEVFRAAADHGVMMEINASPKRLDLDDVRAASAKDHGIPIVINTDSHSVNGFDALRYGVHQARRAGLTADDVANTRSVEDFRDLLRRTR